jgi:hypothetical protein
MRRMGGPDGGPGSTGGEGDGIVMRLVCSESSRTAMSFVLGSLERMSRPAEEEISLCSMRNSTF